MTPAGDAEMVRARRPSRPSVVIRSALNLPVVARLEALDGWLESAFELRLEPMPAAAGAAHPAAAAILWRALLLAREFLQVARVAAFPAPEILSLSPAASRPSEWQAIVALPRVEQVLPRVYSLAFQAGIETVRTVADLPRTTATIAAVQSAVNAQVIGPLRALVPAAEEALADLVRAGGRSVRLADIERAVCQAFGIDRGGLQSGSRARAVNHGRMLAMYLARRHTHAALAEISGFFGRRSHSTVIAAQKTVGEWLATRAKVVLAEAAWDVEEAIRRVEDIPRAG